MKLPILIAALAASLIAEQPQVLVTAVNIETLRQIGAVGIPPGAVDHYQIIVNTRKGVRSVDVTLNISIDGQVRKVSQLAYVTSYGTNDGALGKRHGAVLTFEVPNISRAVVLGEPEVIENPEVKQ